MSSTSLQFTPLARWTASSASSGIRFALRPLQWLLAAPVLLFLAALTAMLLRHPDVPFYEIDHVAFVVLVVGVAASVLAGRKRVSFLARASWPMLGLALMTTASIATQPFDNRTWSLLAAKFIVPFTLFHLAAVVFRGERHFQQFEVFCLTVLAYLCFTSIAFLCNARSLIFPRFILDESLGYHFDRARGPLLEAVANGVSLNMLGLLAVHAILRKRIRGIRAALLLVALPIAILATMTRAVWLSFVLSVVAMTFLSGSRNRRRLCGAIIIMGTLGLLITLTFDDQQHALTDRLNESGPVKFREAVYAGGWQMFLEKPLTGWGVNQLPSELARHVSGYREKELFPHNTYLELLVEHGIFGLALYLWLILELLKLGRSPVPAAETHGFLNKQFHAMWPVMVGVYCVNASVVVMNYQFVNGMLFTLAGMLAAQQRRNPKIRGSAVIDRRGFEPFLV